MAWFRWLLKLLNDFITKRIQHLGCSFPPAPTLIRLTSSCLPHQWFPVGMEAAERSGYRQTAWIGILTQPLTVSPLADFLTSLCLRDISGVIIVPFVGLLGKSNKLEQCQSRINSLVSFYISKWSHEQKTKKLLLTFSPRLALQAGASLYVMFSVRISVWAHVCSEMFLCPW